jgi:hypothetical protein
MTITLDWIFDRTHPIPFSGCWAWYGGVTRDGYAKVKIAGRTLIAHRVAYELKCGPVPEGLEMDHLCRVRCCVNPDHLEAVTGTVNRRRGTGAAVLAARNKTPEMRAVSSRPKAPEHVAKLRVHLTALNRSPEMRALSSMPKPPEQAAKIKVMLTERNRSPEMRAIASRPKSAAHREAIRQAHLARNRRP